MTCSDVTRIILASINGIVNLLGLLYGLALMAQAVWGLVVINLLGVVTDTEHFHLYNIVLSILLVVGFFITIFSIVGLSGSCVACCPQNTTLKGISVCILTTDLFVLFLLFLLSIASVVLVFQYKGVIGESLIPALDLALNESYHLTPNATHESVKFVHSFLGCCGVTSPSDFSRYPGYPDGDTLPSSCCDLTTVDCTLATSQNGTGCGTYLVNTLTTYSDVVGGVCIGQMIVLFLLLLLEVALIVLVITKDNDEVFVKV